MAFDLSDRESRWLALLMASFVVPIALAFIFLLLFKTGLWRWWRR